MSDPAKRGYRWCWLLWLVVPLLMLAAFERGYRSRLASSPIFWEEVAWKVKAQGRLDYVMLGASRVDAALDLPTLRKNLHGAGDSEAVVERVGAGFATIAQHLIGLQRVEEVQPGALKGATVLLESVMGLGEPVPFGVTEPTSWEGRWIHPERRALVFPYLRPRHIPFAWSSTMNFEEKCQVTAYALASKASCFTNRERLRSGLMNRGREKFKLLLAKFGVKEPAQLPTAKLDLKEGGELRLDEGAAALTDIAAKQWAKEFLLNANPIVKWPMLDGLIQYVRSKGGRVYFFDMPIPSVFQAPYLTPSRKADAERFEKFLNDRGSKTIRVEFPVDDSFFPDHSHLGASHAEAYSTALARSILAQIPPNAGPATK